MSIWDKKPSPPPQKPQGEREKKPKEIPPFHLLRSFLQKYRSTKKKRWDPTNPKFTGTEPDYESYLICEKWLNKQIGGE